MTRINSSINPIELCDAHLLAEHREIKRIPNTIKSGKAVIKNIPESFRLGAGHVKYYYNKLEYLHKRYKLLYLECKDRGFNVQNYNSCFENLPQHLYNDWTEDENTRKIVVEIIKLVKY